MVKKWLASELCLREEKIPKTVSKINLQEIMRRFLPHSYWERTNTSHQQDFQELFPLPTLLAHEIY